jgi:hypothetical protein
MRRILSLAFLLVVVSFTALAQNFTEPASPLQPGQDVWLRATNVNFRLGMPFNYSGTNEYSCVMDNPPLPQVGCPIFQVEQNGVLTKIPNVPDGNYSIYLDRLHPFYRSGYAYQPVVVASAPAQSQVTCQFWDYYDQSKSPITQVTEGQRIGFKCFQSGVAINLRQGYTQSDWIIDRFAFLFAPSGVSTNQAFQINIYDGAFVVAQGAAGSTSVTISKRGWFSITVPFTTPIVETAPRLTKRLRVTPVPKTTNDPDSEDGVITLPEFYYFIEIGGTGFNTGGHYTATFRNKQTGATFNEVAFVAAPSGGVPGGFAKVQILIYSGLLPGGVYDIFVRPAFGNGPASPPEEFTFNSPTP